MRAFWKWPSNAKKAHIFIEARSLCGKWMVLSDADTDDVAETDILSDVDCVTCFKKAEKMGLIVKVVKS